jgi:hypothetical protein
MVQVRKYRVWCVTEATHVYEWATAEPTDCPTNPAHTITASKTAIVDERDVINLVTDPLLEPAAPGASAVVANDRPALELIEDLDAWGAVMLTWPHEQHSAAELVVTLRFILKSTGTGTVARMAARAKAQGAGDDSSAAWADTQYDDATVSHTTLGEVFDATLQLDASGFDQGDAVALQVGRNGSHANDTCSEPVQIIGLQAEAI